MSHDNWTAAEAQGRHTGNRDDEATALYSGLAAW
jgi:hypothetical protein